MGSQEEYLRMRKEKADKLGRKFKKMQIFPIQKNKIVVCTFEGDGGFGCNPRYIVEELHKRNSNLKFVWLTKKTDREFPDYVKVRAYTENNLAYHLSTASVWIDNYRKPYGTLKRRGQLYIQTWHGCLGFKPVGLYRGDKFPEIAKRVSEWDSAMIDYVISNSPELEKMFPKKLLYSGETLQSGFPRIDPIINEKEELHRIIREKYNIAQDVKLILFAPTFRGGNQGGKKQVTSECPSIDFERLIQALENKTKSKWQILLRLHPQLSAKIDKMQLTDESLNCIDVSQNPDVNEIIAACDLIITDYSSCAFDACYGHIPVLLFADDVQQYIESRGTFMWEKDQLPFLIAENNDELMENVEQFNYEEYCKTIDEFMTKYKIKEVGNSSKNVADFILRSRGELF